MRARDYIHFPLYSQSLPKDLLTLTNDETKIHCIFQYEEIDAYALRKILSYKQPVRQKKKMICCELESSEGKIKEKTGSEAQCYLDETLKFNEMDL